MQQQNILSISLRDERATRRLAEKLAKICSPGTTILLRGPLGAGKTTFVDGFAHGLGAGDATSPTFVIAHSYPAGQVPLWHLDLYRLTDAAEIADLDFAQYLSDDAITLVEWPERAHWLWPPERIEVQFTIEGPARRAKVSASLSYEPVLERLRAAIAADE